MSIDILEFVDVVVPPAYSCGEFEVTASTILECQDFVAAGCPGVAPYELAPLYFASLADHRFACRASLGLVATLRGFDRHVAVLVPAAAAEHVVCGRALVARRSPRAVL